MISQQLIANRLPVWKALSNLYIDTELQDYDFKNIAYIIKESPYQLEEVKNIHKYEVFPVLYQNLLIVAGVWDGFDEKWLAEEIIKSIKKRNKLKTLFIEIVYATQKAMFKEIWKKIENTLTQNKPI